MSVCRISRGEGTVPVYRQIALWLKKEVSENYFAGDMLPSEIELSKRLGVNRHTLRRGMDELISEGFVERRHGVGVIVLEKAYSYSIDPKSRFTEAFEALGVETESKLLSKKIVFASDVVAKKLRVEPGSQLAHLETLRMVDQKPFCLISHFLSLDSYLLVFDVFEGGSLHGFLKKYLEIELERKECRVSAALPTFEDAGQLLMPKSEPVLKSKSINVEITTGKPVEYAITRFRGGSAELTFNF